LVFHPQQVPFTTWPIFYFWFPMLVTLRSPTHPYHSLYFLQSSLEESVGKSTGEAFTLQGTPTTFQPSREKRKSDQAKDQSPLWLLDNSLQKERKKKKSTWELVSLKSLENLLQTCLTLCCQHEVYRLQAQSYKI
jgi:hypothetical protein